MINVILFLVILLFLIYFIYDQFGMDYLKGKTYLKAKLVKQSKVDIGIFIALILLIIYQSLSSISSLTFYLLITLILFSFYGAFVRFPVLLLKEKGFFFGNFYFDYNKIEQLNLAQQNIFVIDLKNGKRLLVRLLNETDKEKIVQFFGGYKQKETE